MPLLRTISSLIALLAATALSAHEHHQVELAEEMAKAANAFLDTLNDEERAGATFPADSPERENFHYVPLERKGLVLKAMRAKQRTAVFNLLHTALSSDGSYKALQIMELESVLHVLENNAPHRDPELYYLAIFGTPGKNPWGWRFEGHHLSVNQTITDEGISGTPLFFGANPGHVKSGPKEGTRLLGKEEDMGREFILSLDQKQRQQAVINSTAIKEILTGQNSEVSALSNEGIPYTQLSADQQQHLRVLLKYYLGRHELPISEAALAKIEANGMENLIFAWAGSTDLGEKHYYRIQGPTFVIEYANTQNDANHHHTAFRDFENDFGRDVLREHYRRSH